MLDFLLTSFAFLCALVVLPALIQSFIVLRLFNYIYLKCLSVIYPDLQFVRHTTTRTLLDTHRNQGIFSVLMCVRGDAQPEVVQRHLLEVAKRRDKFGAVVFPRLKQTLVARCGCYAWQRDGHFDIGQHVVVAPGTYRGRNISEINIQDYVSNIVSKYLQPNIPPWQLTIIPTSEGQHYILLKLHHLLLWEGLNVADLLPLIPPIRQTLGPQTNPSPVLKAFKPPKSIPYLQERLAEEFTNKWNEFIANYDPLECPEIFKNGPGFYQFLAITLIALTSTVKECRKDFNRVQPDFVSKLKFVWVTFRRERLKRQLTFGTFVYSIFVTLDPRNVIVIAVKYAWYVLVSLLLKSPVLVYYEMASLYGCLTLTYCPYPNTFVGLGYRYLPLFYYALKEALACLALLYSAPRRIIAEVFLEPKALQNVTLCGRKVVAWSHPVKTDYIRAIARKVGATETEICLAAISAAVSRYLTHSHRDEPIETLPVTLTNVSSNYVFSTGTNVRAADSVSGLLCVRLPVLTSEKQANILNNTEKLKVNFANAVEKQSIVYLLSLLEIRRGILTKLLPGTLLTVILKYLCGKFSVAITEVTSRHPNVTQQTLWGQEVASVIFWRPPQANLSISLCVNEYADHVRLGVMCDALMGPQHPDLVKGFPEHVKALSLAYGVE